VKVTVIRESRAVDVARNVVEAGRGNGDAGIAPVRAPK
jgi:hypothetical protein